MLGTIQATWNDLIQFIRKPSEVPDSDQSAKQKTKRVWALLLMELPVMAVIMWFVAVVERAGWIQTGEHKLNDLIRHFPLWIMVLSIVVIVPFFEELIFRLYLRFRFNLPIRFLIAFSAIGGRAAQANTAKALHSAWNKNYAYIFFFSVLLFGGVHIFNFETSTIPFYFFPLLVAPQLLLGVLIGYLRVRYNLFTGFVLHALHNGIFLAIMLLNADQPEVIFEQQTASYHLKVEESGWLQTDQLIHMGRDSIIFKGLSIKAAVATLKHIDEGLVRSSDSSKANKKINLSYHGSDADKKGTFILNELSAHLDFSLRMTRQAGTVWELYVMDASKINRHVSDTAYANEHTQITTEQISLKNASPGLLANILTERFGRQIRAAGFPELRLTIVLYSKTFAMLQKELLNDFGLGLRPGNEDLEVVYLEFGDTNEE